MIFSMKKKFLALFFMICPLYVNAEALPDFLLPLRDAFYEQTHTAAQAELLTAKTVQTAREILTGFELDNSLSVCEYYLARIYHFELKNEIAMEHYQKGLEFAEKSIKQQPSSTGWEMRAANISQLCTLKPVGWVMLNGLDVEKFAKNSLKLNSRNAGAQYLIASRWVYAPPPFSNVKKGINDMLAILYGAYDSQKDDLFNVYSALAYGYIREKKIEEAKTWIDKALSVYPTNKYANDLLTGRDLSIKYETE
ncbi:hypothetical protein AGMMS50212_01000 [Spirochaetia bacterium]|nr:hypothetical protein AGMMS50212_01000 [Spirochaetia bacterium]